MEISVLAAKFDQMHYQQNRPASSRPDSTKTLSRKPVAVQSRISDLVVVPYR